jgi:hypothetical protein
MRSPWSEIVGSVFTTDQVRSLLGSTSRQAVHDRVLRHTLLCLKTRDGHRVYPTYQFVSRDVVGGLSDVLTRVAGTIDDWTLASWLRTPQVTLGGASIIDELLRQGRADDTILQLADVAAKHWSR